MGQFLRQISITDGTTTYYLTADHGLEVPSNKPAFVAALDTDAGLWFSGGGVGNRFAYRNLNGAEVGYQALAGEGWHSGGVKLGTDQDANWFDDSSHGAASTTMYIGNRTIDTSASDKRKKKVRGKTKRGLKELLSLDVVDFTWKKEFDVDTKTIHTGLLAQDVYKKYPWLVIKPKDEETGLWKMNKDDLVSLLVSSVQELYSEVSRLRRELKKCKQ